MIALASGLGIGSSSWAPGSRCQNAQLDALASDDARHPVARTIGPRRRDGRRSGTCSSRPDARRSG
jgi:hypothetical protein